MDIRCCTEEMAIKFAAVYNELGPAWPNYDRITYAENLEACFF